MEMRTGLNQRRRHRGRAALAGVAILLGTSIAGTGTSTAADIQKPSHVALDAQQRAAIDWLTTTQHLSRAQATDRISHQDADRSLADHLAASIGAEMSGSWIDPLDGHLVVGVTTAPAAATVRQAGAEPRLVARSLAQLQAVQSDIVRSGLPEGSAVRIDPATNTVIANLPTTATASQVRPVQDAVDRAGSAARIARVDAAASTTVTFRGGQEITGPQGACTSGFNVTRGTDKRFFVTAGHCTAAIANWSRNGVALGTTVASDFPLNDFGLVRITDPKYWNPVGEVASLGAPQPIFFTGQAPVGTVVCKTGRTTGTNCGQILAYNVTVFYTGGYLVFDLTDVNVCARPGDSGGPVFDGTVAQGIVSGSLLMQPGDQCLGAQSQMYAQPIGEALTALNVRLL